MQIVIALLNLIAIVVIFMFNYDFQRRSQWENRQDKRNIGKPEFFFERLEIDYEISSNPSKSLGIAWLYPDDKRRDIIKKEFYRTNFDVKETMRFKNISQGIAKDIRITVHHINGIDYLDKLKELGGWKDSIKFKYYNRFSLNVLDYDGQVRRHMLYSGEKVKTSQIFRAQNNNSTVYKYRVLPPEYTFDLDLNKYDREILNFDILYNFVHVKPLIKINIEYKDVFGEQYEDQILIGLESLKIKSNESINSYVVRTALNELDKDKLIEENFVYERKQGIKKYDI